MTGREKYNWLFTFIKESLLIAAVLIVLQFVLPRSVVNGRSMEPNLRDGQRLASSPIPYLLGEPQRGDIVILNPIEPDGPHLVKRIIGLPGEIVQIAHGQLIIDGSVVEETYVQFQCEMCGNGQWQLGPTQYFIVGDNRMTSRDSRDYGPVERADIAGQVLFRWYPFTDFEVFVGTLR